MTQTSKIRDILKSILPWLVIVGVMYVTTLLKLPLVITNVFFVFSTFLCMLKLWNYNSESKVEIIIICVGMIIRILVCILDIYGNKYFTVPFSGDDSLNFYKISVEYYHGDYSRILTKYPYIINAIYQIAGLNRFAAQYVNILCWCFSALVMQKTCSLLKIEGKLRVIALALVAFMPFNICISSILMRDIFVYLAITLAVYCLLKWMISGNYINVLCAIGITVPAILIHNCALAMLLVIGVVAALYSPRKAKFCVERKFLFIFLFALLSMAAIFLIPKIRGLFLTQIPFTDGGIIESINGRLYYFYTHTGGSTYLKDVYVTSYIGLVFGTLQRMVYFLLSPLPMMWRGASDIVAFVISSSFYVFCIGIAIIKVLGKIKDSKITVLLSVIFCVSAIFAWGVSNSGTAIRHREKLFFVIVLTLVYCMQIISNKRKGEIDE